MPRQAPFRVEFNEDAGYDMMSSGYRILDANNKLVCVVDVADFLDGKSVGGKWVMPTYEEMHAEHPEAKDLARRMVKGLNT